jgi:hypothetical protein
MPTLGNTPRPAYVYDTETDTWVPVGVGAHTHSDIPNTLVDAKGDLITATADNVPARLAKGADGTILVADSTTSTGLSWQPYGAIQSAGKNKVINGDFGIWQRGTSFTPSQSVEGYTADRWQQFWIGSGGTTTFSRQAFTPGSAPVNGYEGSFFARAVTSANASYYSLYQKIEDVRTLAGQTVTISFWARATSTVGFLVYFRQNFGSGGSVEVDTTSPVSVNSTSWNRYSVTVSAPSISGKTIGASNSIHLIFAQSGGTVASNTIDFWGIQVEAGPIATQFTTATGTIQGELALCQRYYYRQTATQNFSSFGYGTASLTTGGVFYVSLPQTMRAEPNVIDFSTLSLTDQVSGFTFSGLGFGNQNGRNIAQLTVSGATGLTQYRSYFIVSNGSTSGYLGLSAEL